MHGSPQPKVLLGGRDWQLTSLFCEQKQEQNFTSTPISRLVSASLSHQGSGGGPTHRGLRQWCRHDRVLLNYFSEQYFINCLVKQGTWHCLEQLTGKGCKGSPSPGRAPCLSLTQGDELHPHLDRFPQPRLRKRLCFKREDQEWTWNTSVQWLVEATGSQRRTVSSSWYLMTAAV